jgi:hypothetical protein
VPADETLCRRLHCGEIERLGDAPGTAAFQREIGPAIDDAIKIMAADGRKARIE